MVEIKEKGEKRAMRSKYCEIWRSDGGSREGCRLVGCDKM